MFTVKGPPVPMRLLELSHLSSLPCRLRWIVARLRTRIDTEQKLSIAVMPLTYARELPAAQRMQRMRYPHKIRGCDRIICISNGATSDWRRAPMPFR
jgi:hypothetical protein